MANSFATQPIVIDTDITSFRISANVTLGIRVIKLILAVGAGGASTAGTVTIQTTDGNSVNLYPPMVVSAGSAANTILYYDGPDQALGSALTWKDFSVTGVSATGTRLWLWVR